jgi:hypothetical protein
MALPVGPDLVKALATTRVDVHRDADAGDSDGYGDETETAGPPAYEDIPFSIIERTQRVPDPTSGNFIPVQGYAGRCGAEHDVRKGDRIQDRKDGAWYAVAEVTTPQNPAVMLDRRMDLKMTGAAPTAPWEPASYGLGESPLGGA